MGADEGDNDMEAMKAQQNYYCLAVWRALATGHLRCGEYLMKQVLSPSFSKWGNKGKERLNNLPEARQG